MGFFDRIFRRWSKASPPPPDELRERLFDAASTDDRASLEGLCRRNEAAIAEHFPSWQKVPDDVRADPSRLNRYARGLIGVANAFASGLGRPDLLARLTGGTNPIERWKEAMNKSRSLMDEMSFEEAAGLLETELEQVKRLSGGDAGFLKAVTLGRIGECYFLAGKAERALDPLSSALAVCREGSDREGILAYLDGLYQAHRYLGDAEEAARFAADLATELDAEGRRGEARWMRRQAGIVRAGEPLNRVIVEVEGDRYELDELPKEVESARFLFHRSRVTLGPVRTLVDRGGALSAEGRHEEAAALFRDAQRRDPYAPEPVYEEALTLLYQKRPGEAAERYARVEALAPGWYDCRAERWLALELEQGRAPYEAFLALRAFEGGLPAPSEEKLAMARRAIEAAPDLALLRLREGEVLASMGRTIEARAAFEAGLQCAREPDIRSRLLVKLCLGEEPSPERDARLHEALDASGHLLSAAMAQLALCVSPPGA